MKTITRVTLFSIEQGKKIQAIKAVRALTGWGLKEAKFLVDDVEGGYDSLNGRYLNNGISRTFETEHSAEDVREQFGEYAHSYDIVKVAIPDETVSRAAALLAISFAHNGVLLNDLLDALPRSEDDTYKLLVEVAELLK